MRRIHGIELADQSWFPQLLRDASMAFLRLGGEQAGHAAMIHPILEAALRRSGEREILDLCSGGGGQALSLARRFAAQGSRVVVTMTDLRPNAGAGELVAASEEGLARYAPGPVDARAVSDRADGLRTMLNAFHHFQPADAREILASCVRARKPIAVVEVARRSPPWRPTWPSTSRTIPRSLLDSRRSKRRKDRSRCSAWIARSATRQGLSTWRGGSTRRPGGRRVRRRRRVGSKPASF